ncbi:alpha/beta hydrolase family protein [Granulicoccus phenolivorans]|uniref:alpha/beta hydrolase family protein n=1 Tax=Granulicoccus phenolivorans TaxID=266854 RepID=UPI00041C72B7|nr:alpha/beta family hydrolase [Granulicoccus phenolivorans]
MTLLGEVVVREVDTPQGPGRWHVSPATADGGVRALLVLGHGAGGGLDGVDLVALAALLPARGITVARFEQPWKVAGKKVATRPPTLDAAWLAAVPALTAEPGLGGVPLVVGGHSAGARVACRCAQELGAAAVLALSFPLHPPGKPESSRLSELLAPTVPTLVLQGDRDSFGSAGEIRAAVASADAGERITVVEVTGAGHPLGVPARVRVAGEHRAWIADRVLQFLDGVIP